MCSIFREIHQCSEIEQRFSQPRTVSISVLVSIEVKLESEKGKLILKLRSRPLQSPPIMPLATILKDNEQILMLNFHQASTAWAKESLHLFVTL